MAGDVCVYLGEALASYHFGPEHPFGPHRYPAFTAELTRRGLLDRLCVCEPLIATEAQLERFHTAEYIQQVRRQSATGAGFLDDGDTPAFAGVFEAAAAVVGSTVDAVERLVQGGCRRGFVPIAGLHHARRNRAGGFCVFNDCGVAIETLRQKLGVQRVGYVDIDAHHGDGVFYGFAHDPDVIIVDFHEDGRFLYPGTGAEEETGQGAAAGTKLNVALPPRADDNRFFQAWEQAERFLEGFAPEFLLLQCGADGLAGDPITDLGYTTAVHTEVTRRLCALAERHCRGRILALGGGGYNPDNLARAWCAVVEALLEGP